MDITIRPAIHTDAPIITRYNIPMAMETEGRQLDPGVVEKGVNQLLKTSERGFYLIAEVNGTPVGQCLITFEWSDWRCGDFWWLQSVYVEPQFRRQGVFSALYEDIIRRAELSELVTGVRLYVEKENISAQKTYQRLGMKQTDYMMFERDFSLKIPEP